MRSLFYLFKKFKDESIYMTHSETINQSASVSGVEKNCKHENTIVGFYFNTIL